MSGTTEQLEGGCLCGAVRFIATGQPKGIYWCHCQSCRRHTGAPVAVFVLFDCEAYAVTKGEITKFDSTPGRTRRGFCARCGSTLTCESLPGPTETHFMSVRSIKPRSFSRRQNSTLPRNGFRGFTALRHKARLVPALGKC